MNNNNINVMITQINQALEQLHNPKSTSDMRQTAQEFLEEVKQRAEAYSYAIQILSTTQNDITKHYGLHIIEILVKNRWYNASDNERELVKKEILDLVARVPGTEQKFIREKLVTILVEIIKRDWPQRWINLLGSLVDIAKISDTQAELVLLTFGQLPHDIIFENTSSSNLLSEQRRKDLMAGINVAVSSLFEFFYSMLETRYAQYKQVVSTDPTNAKNANTSNIHLINVLLNSLRSYIDWVPVKLIFNHKLDLIFCQLLLDIPFRMGACECLMLFLNRKVKTPEENKSDLISTPFKSMENIIKSILISKDFEDDYSYHKRLTQTLTILGTLHLSIYDGKGILPNNYNQYLDLMLQMISHPSILLCSLAMPFWLAFLKQENYDIPFKDEIMKKILEISLLKMVRTGDPEKEENPQSKYSELDFGTSKEWSNFYGSIRNRYIEFIKIIAAHKHEMSFFFIALKIIEMLESLKNNANPLTHEQTLITESHAYSLDCILQAIKESNAQFFDSKNTISTATSATTPFNALITTTTEKLFSLLIEITHQDPNVTSFQIDCISALSCYYQYHPETIQFVLNKIIPLVHFKPTPLAGVDPNSRHYQTSILQAHRRAITSLINLSSSLNDVIKPYFGTIYQSMGQLFQQNLLNESEKVMIYHLLAVFSNNLSSYQQIVDFLKEILAIHITQWTGAEITSALQSPDSFLSYLGLLQPDNQDPLFINRRKNLSLMVSTFQTFWKKTQIPINSSDEGFSPFIANGTSYNGKWPISNFVKEILPNIVSLTRTLHSLWDPKVKQTIHPSYHAIYQLDDAITAPLLGYDYHKENKSEAGYITFLRNLLDTLRDSCYDIIGYGFTHGDELFGIPSLPNILYDSVFSYLEFCENRHLKIIIKLVLQPLIKLCPNKLQSQIFDPLFPPFLSTLYNRLKSGWGIIATRSQRHDSFGAENEKNEIIEDKILRDLTFEYLNWITLFVHQPYIISSGDNIIPPTMYGLSCCLLSIDHPILKKTIHLTIQFIDALGNDQKFYKLLGSDVFGCCLEVLKENKISDLNNDLMTLMKSIYIKFYQLCNLPQNILLTLPNITPSILEKFNRDLADSKAEKNQKLLFRRLLNDVIGINLNKTKKESILDLPEKLYIQKVANSSWLESNEKSSLADLFN
ncbi:hypothetical protein CYY_008030 [Polysphondylium violaceum]|uniref:Importin N-terminal domain-containing protein n=1 Tax=Polysphondylium violaceum TaxID=133409 RepID=A0A8J4V1P3_9MYCE|nr:hypothetical protein CYY_008030 [Polysphondylium violaceum]